MTLDVSAVQDNDAEWVTAATPVPESVMLSGEFVALLATEMPPVALPVADGAKVAVNVADCPGFKISPPETPEEVNPAPETVTLVTVIVEFPAFVSVTFCVLLLDTFTLPKPKLVELELSVRVDGLTVSVAALLVALPVPLVTVTVNVALLFEVVPAVE